MTIARNSTPDLRRAANRSRCPCRWCGTDDIQVVIDHSRKMAQVPCGTAHELVVIDGGDHAPASRRVAPDPVQQARRLSCRAQVAAGSRRPAPWRAALEAVTTHRDARPDRIMPWPACPNRSASHQSNQSHGSRSPILGRMTTVPAILSCQPCLRGTNATQTKPSISRSSDVVAEIADDQLRRRDYRCSRPRCARGSPSFRCRLPVHPEHTTAAGGTVR